MLFILIGKTASGRNAIKNELVKRGFTEYKPCIEQIKAGKPSLKLDKSKNYVTAFDIRDNHIDADGAVALEEFYRDTVTIVLRTGDKERYKRELEKRKKEGETLNEAVWKKMCQIEKRSFREMLKVCDAAIDTEQMTFEQIADRIIASGLKGWQ